MERIAGALQENVLTLLCYDPSSAKIIRNTVDPGLFESSTYRQIAEVAIEFLDTYGTPVAEHLPDILESDLEDHSDPRARLLQGTLLNLHESRESVNSEYTLSQLSVFIDTQSLKSGIVEAVSRLDDGDLEGARLAIEDSRKRSLSVFNPGTQLIDKDQSLSFLDDVEKAFPTGIPELDMYNLGPIRKGLHLLIAPAKRGKSWWLCHLAKQALLHRYRPLVITCEMSEQLYSKRMLQALFSISKREAQVKVSRFEKTPSGHLAELDERVLERPRLVDRNIRPVLAKMLRRLQNRPKMYIKEFASGRLSVAGLRAYLDMFIETNRYVPDIILIDYPDLFEIKNPNNKRVELGQIFVDIRGIAQEYNLAIAAVTQGNKESAKARVVDETMVGEDWSKIATADTVLTYSQTPEEKTLGLARLFVSNARDDKDRFMVLISQAYAIGQFVIDSCIMEDSSWNIIDSHSGSGKASDDGDG